VVEFVSKALKSGLDAKETLAALLDEALKRGSGDNMTAVLIQFKWPESAVEPDGLGKRKILTA